MRVEEIQKGDLVVAVGKRLGRVRTVFEDGYYVELWGNELVVTLYWKDELSRVCSEAEVKKCLRRLL